MSILQRSAKQVADKLREVSEKDLEPLMRFKLLLKTHLRMSEAYKKEVKIFFLDEEQLATDGNEINKQFQRDILSIYKNELENLKAKGHINHQNLTILALNILGVINWELRWYRPNGPIPLEQITEEILNFILYGVIGRPGPDKER